MLIARCGTVRAALTAALLAGGCTGDPAVRKQQYLESASRYVGEGQYAHAIIEYRNAIDLDATFGAARAGLARAYERNGETARALQEYVRAADLLPADLDVQLTAGTYLLAARKPEEALARADAALKVQPENLQAHVLRGNALAGLSSFEEALESIEEAIRLEPGRSATYTHLGAVELARGRRDEAEAAFRRAIALAPKVVESHLSAGNFYWAVGRVTDAERAVRRALDIDPGNRAANRAMAALTLASGRQQEAEPYLRRMAEEANDSRAVLGLVDYYLMFGRPRDAISRLEALPNAGRDVPGAWQRLARAHAAIGDRTKARDIVNELLGSSARDVEAQLIRGQLFLEEGRREEAFSTVRDAVAVEPSSAPAQFALGRLYAARGDVQGAEMAFREVLKLNPRASAAQLALARLQMMTGKPEESVRTAEDAARNQPRSIDARLTLVRGLLSAKNLARAELEMTALRADYPGVSDVHAVAGMLALLKKDTSGARAAFTRAQALNPRSMDALAGLIETELSSNNPTGAKALVEKRLEGEPTPEILMLAARTYWSAKDLASAEKVLRRALEADPSMLSAYAMLGQAYVAQGKLDQARAEFEALAARQTRPVAALTMSGMILQTQGNLPLARQRFEEVLGIDSRAAIAANNLAWILAESGENLDRALELALTATAASPDSPQLMDTLGWVYYKKQLSQRAIPVLRRCAELAPSHSLCNYHLGLAYRQVGDTERSKAAFERALATGAPAATVSEIRRLLSEPQSGSTGR